MIAGVAPGLQGNDSWNDPDPTEHVLLPGHQLDNQQWQVTSPSILDNFLAS